MWGRGLLVAGGVAVVHQEAPGEKVASGRVPPEDALTGTRGRLGASDEELRVELALSTLQTRQGNKTSLRMSTRQWGQWQGSWPPTWPPCGRCSPSREGAAGLL